MLSSWKMTSPSLVTVSPFSNTSVGRFVPTAAMRSLLLCKTSGVKKMFLDTTGCDLRKLRIHTATRSSRSEEHTSELQSRFDLVCRLLLEKKNNKQTYKATHYTIQTTYTVTGMK